jgi:CBS-domain-containing membrane protein
LQTDIHPAGRNDQREKVDALMQEHDVRHIPVLDEYQYPWGLLSQRDIFRSAILRSLSFGERAENMMLETSYCQRSDVKRAADLHQKHPYLRRRSLTDRA